MSANRNVAVFGAYGHTARFVIDELCARGWTPVLGGRDPQRLDELAARYPSLSRRLAAADDPRSLDRAFDGAVGVINCAGPFLDSALPVAEAARRAGAHYLDLCAEQQAVLDVYQRFANRTDGSNLVILPAMAFYGGLADLLVTATLGDWHDADHVDVAVALDSWHPTAGTRRTGARNQVRRRVVSGAKLDHLADPAPTRDWSFPAPIGTLPVVGLPLSEVITISRHVRCDELQSWMNLAPLRDLRDPATPPPTPVDAQGRSAQRFVLDTTVRRGGETRRGTTSGGDIYAVSAPLVVEALERIVDGRCRGAGVLAPGEAFDARDFLRALATVEHRAGGA
jgi:short subunit dehydrogenase-like uncharacterized protein